MPNNKLSNLLSVVDSVSLSETIVIITKNIQQSNELNDFFKNKGISSFVVQEKNDVELHSKDINSILIVINDHIAFLKEVAISYVISVFSSISLDELKAKANLCHLKEKLVLVELISKFDFQFIQGLYKFSEIVIERFSFLDNDKMMENKNARILSFLKNTMTNTLLLKNEYSLPSEIENVIDSANGEDLKLFFKSFFSLSVYSKMPTLDFMQSQTKGTKEFKITLSQGYLDNIVEESLKEYFLKLDGLTVENVSQLTVEEKKTIIVLKSKDLNKNDILTYLLNNTYSGLTLEAESINEKLMEEMGRFGEGNSEGYAPRRDRDGGSYQRRDRDGGSGYQRREGGSSYPRREGNSGGYQRREGGSSYPRREGSSGGGYQRRDGDTGGSYQRRDRDGGSTGGGYQRRDSYSPRPSYSGGYDKYKNSSSDTSTSISGYESKDSGESRESKPSYYGKSSYSGGSSSSYGDKKPYRSFSNDFGSGDSQNSGKDRSGYDNKRKDFRGGSDRRSGSSYGGGYKKPYERSSSSSSGYSNYGKDRYSKGGSSFQSNNEESDSDSE